jgi:hypothetical protein
MRNREIEIVQAIRLIRSVCEQYGLEFEVSERGHIEVWDNDEVDLSKFVFRKGGVV